MGRALVIVLLVVGLLSGCSHTSVRDEWMNPSYQGPPVHSVLVLCLPADSKEKECEDDFVTKFAKRGIAATPGYSTAALSASRASAMAKAREMGVPRLLVSRFVKQQTVIEAYPIDSADLMWPEYDMWMDYEYVQSDYLVFATILYDTATGKTIWAAESETLERPSERKNMMSYVKAMVWKMEHQRLVAR